MNAKMIRVVITKHALERLFGRFPKYKKFNAKTVVNVIENVIRDGVVLVRDRDVKISTSNYTLCCALEDKLVIKTVMRTEEMSDRYRKAMIYGRKSPWRIVYVENVRQIDKWCKQLENMKRVCKICGISKEQTPIERCKIYGFYICSFCCESIGGYSDRCKGCTFDVVHIKTTQKQPANPTQI